MPRSSMSSDRRSFLGRMAISASGAGLASLLPLSLLEAGEVCAAMAPPAYPDPCGDWTLDDICNAYPPYASDIRRAPLPHALPAAEVADADRMWVA